MFGLIKKMAVNSAASYAKEYLTVENITQWVLDAINSLLAKAMKNVDSEKLTSVCATCEQVSELCSILSKALADKSISTDEATAILAQTKTVIGDSGISNKKISSVIDEIATKIKEKI